MKECHRRDMLENKDRNEAYLEVKQELIDEG